ncbi:MAG: peptide chain release factor N(5)-glutamine methyltransferase [Oligoflexia bacterium]|nr:peptide chain release factor N(5)-glutamine methyltransferase [Oligoflexia bacterium]
MTVKEILQTISKKNYEDAIWLLSFLLKKNRGELLLDSSYQLSKDEEKVWLKYWKKRVKGEPLQYITGNAPFYGEEFLVNESVLIPRPETEILVERCLKKFSNEKELKVIDIGTGSGVIAITLKQNCPGWIISASDISQKALKTAKQNADEKKCSVQFFLMSGLDSTKFKGSLDLVVSNPPYLSESVDYVEKQVLKYEPRVALFPYKKPKKAWSGDQGTWMASQLIEECLNHRVRFLLMEVSARISYKLERHWRKNTNIKRIERFSDLAGRKRFLDLEFIYG